MPQGGGLRQLLLEELHCSALGGHLGARKLCAALFERVWWPRLRATVATFVAGCHVC